MIEVSERFPRYRKHQPAVPVWCVTPDIDGCLHRFFDTSPISPSGRYLALTRLRREDVMPVPGDACDIVVVDLREGVTEVVASSRGWDTQLGAQVQWGADDSQLFFNDMDTGAWRPYGVVMDPATGRRRELEGSVYNVARDGTVAASPCLLRTGLTQAGYGVLAPASHVARNRGAPADDGVYVVDIATGKQHLLVSIAQIVEAVLDPGMSADGDFYGFHVKWNRQADRLMFVLRWLSRGRDGPRRRRRIANAITMRRDGSDIAVCFPGSMWVRGGHHPDWAPDGVTATMNLRLEPGGELRLVRAVPRPAAPGDAALGTRGGDEGGRRQQPLGYVVEAMTTVPGSGHPSLHANGTQLVTDVYLNEGLAYGDGTTPIRWIDVADDTEEVLVRIDTDPPFPGPRGELRIDPHPAWDRSYRYVTFNGCEQGIRRVYIADLGAKIR